MNLRVLIATTEAAYREASAKLLIDHPGIDAVTTVSDGEQLVARAMQAKPDIACIDIELADLDAPEAIRHLLAAWPEMKILALSSAPDPQRMLGLLDAGAAGVVSKKGGARGLWRAVLGVARHDRTYLCPEVAVDVLSAMRAQRVQARNKAPRQSVPRSALPLRRSVRQTPAIPDAPASAASLECFQQIFADSPIATFVIDREHAVMHWNKACESLTTLPASEIIGTGEAWRAFYHDERPLMVDLILDGLMRGDFRHLDHEGLHKSPVTEDAYEAEEFVPGLGETGRWILFSMAPVRDRGGRILGMIAMLQDVTDRRLAEAALRASEVRYRALSITDNQTGLFNARHFHDLVKAESARALRYGHPLSLINIAVDNFRRFNETYGPLEGDRMLEKLADVIHHHLRLGDSAYRKSGMEFAILLPETGLQRAQQVAERLRAAFSVLPFTPWSRLPLYCSVSIGLACYEQCEDPGHFVRRAEVGSASARQQGGNRIVAPAPGEIATLE